MTPVTTGILDLKKADPNMEALIIRIGFGGVLYTMYNKP